MLRIDNLKLPVGAKEDKLRAACAHALRVSEEALVSVHLLRRSIDAREGVKLVCSCAVEVKNESGVLRRCKNKNVQPYAPKKYTPPAPVSAPEVSPVVIGAGPAGLFCALLLARCGARPILLERGRAVEQRKRDVEHFWRTGELDLTSNVQFGEGGAGAFSDGKLNTGTKDLRHGYILEEFVRFGASEDILVDAKPHVGTDKLYVVLQNLRREIIDRGGEVRFSHKVVDIEQNSGSVTALRVSSPEGDYVLPARHVVLAPGHSAPSTPTSANSTLCASSLQRSLRSTRASSGMLCSGGVSLSSIVRQPPQRSVCARTSASLSALATPSRTSGIRSRHTSQEMSKRIPRSVCVFIALPPPSAIAPAASGACENPTCGPRFR